MQAMKDPEFLEDVKKLNFDIEPMDAEETAKVANRLFETPAEAVAKIRATVARPVRVPADFRETPIATAWCRRRVII